jgi:hypothetical protein
MLVKLNNGVVEKYPYSIGQLRKDNPQTSFPKAPSEKCLAEWGVMPVQKTDPPVVDPVKQRTIEGTPVCEEGVWKQSWVILDEPSQPSGAEVYQMQIEEVRNLRNSLLKESDWTQLGDVPQEKKDEWAAYRQQLRDLTKQEGFPRDVHWPNMPQLPNG